MLIDRDQELLSAYVDGELGPRRRREVRRLLEESAEARELVRHMQEDAARLRDLPPRRLAPDFAQKVLRAIDGLPYHGRRTAAALPAWAGLSAAAAILLAVGTAAFFYFLANRERGSSAGQEVAQVLPSDTRSGGDPPKIIEPTPRTNRQEKPATNEAEERRPARTDVIQK